LLLVTLPAAAPFTDTVNAQLFWLVASLNPKVNAPDFSTVTK